MSKCCAFRPFTSYLMPSYGVFGYALVTRSKGMTGWGEDYVANIAITTGSTGLTSSQVKVITMRALTNIAML